MSDPAEQHAIEVKRRHEHELLRKANVLAVGVGFLPVLASQLGRFVSLYL